MIPLFKVFMSPDVQEPLGRLLMSGYIGQGEKVDEFESLLAARFGTPFVSTVNSCTAALTLAVRLVTDSPDDEVLTTPLTCFATSAAILANGVRLRWVDIDPTTCNLDLDDLERKLSPRTKAVVVVHWGGYPLDLDHLHYLLDQHREKYGHRPAVIEDCAHAWGSIYKWRLIGTHGNLCAFSFQAIKTLTTGDGGCLITPEAGQWARAKLLRWFGIDRTQPSTDARCDVDIPEWGYKFHMNDINATIGIHNLPHADSLLKVSRDNAAYYDRELADVPGLTLMERRPDRSSSYWLYTVRVEDRDRFVVRMREAGVMASRVHERNDRHPCVRRFAERLPNLDRIAADMVCIPVGWWVKEEERAHIVQSIRKGW
jgi:dTDP-4-amino-4,6-dideoxygalactose transaminase